MGLVRSAEAPSWELPGWKMSGLASPSRGSTELSTWRVSIDPNTDGPLHTVDREIVLMVLEGVATVTLEGTAVAIPAGDAFVIPPHTERKLGNAHDTQCELISVMGADGRSVRSDGSPSFIPWAQ